MKRDLIAVIWSLLVTGAISKWAFHVAYLERGYKAVGGEYLVILVAYVAAWKAINYLFDSFEELENPFRGPQPPPAPPASGRKMACRSLSISSKALIRLT